MAYQNAYIIRFIAMIDMAFATLLVCIYMQKLLTPISVVNQDNNEVQRMPTLKLVLLGPIIFNAFQIVMAYNLFSAAGRGCDSLIAYAKANTWFQFSCLMLMFLMIKLFLILWFPVQGSLGRRDIFGSTLVVLEAVFKIFGLFFVKEFIDDLREVLHTLPTPQYYCVYTSPPPPPPHFLLTRPPVPTAPTISNNNSNFNPAYQTTGSTYPFTNNILDSGTKSSPAQNQNQVEQSSKTTDQKRGFTIVNLK